MAETEQSSRLPIPGRRSLLPAPKKVIYTSNEKDVKDIRPSAVQTDEEKLSQKQFQAEAEQVSRLPQPGRKSRTLIPPQKRPESSEREIKDEQEPIDTQTDEEKLYHKQYQVGDRVVIGDVKLGRLLYFGTTHLAKGLWCGVELDDCEGKHDGKVQGVRYFKCKKGHGIFAPIEKVKKYEPSAIDNYEWDNSVEDLVHGESKPKKKLFQPKFQKLAHSEQTFIVVSQKSTKEVSSSGNSDEALSPDVKECLSSDRRQYLNLTFDAEHSPQPHNLPDIVSPLAYRCGANNTDNSASSNSRLKDADYSDNDSSLGLINSRLLEQADILRDISLSSKKSDEVSLLELEQQLQLLSLGSAGTPDSEHGNVMCSTPLVVVRRQNKSQNQGNRVCNIPLDSVFVFPSPKKPTSPRNVMNRTFDVDDVCSIPSKDSTIADDLLKENTETKISDGADEKAIVEPQIELPEADQEESLPDVQRTFIIEQGITEIEYSLDSEPEEEVSEVVAEKSAQRVSFHENTPPPRQEKRPMIDSGISEREDFEFDHGEFIENFDANGIDFPYSQFHQSPVGAEDATSDTTINNSRSSQMSENNSDSATMQNSSMKIAETNGSRKMDQLAVNLDQVGNKSDRPTSYLSTTSTDTGYVPDTPTEERDDRTKDLMINEERIVKNDTEVCESIMPDVTREGMKREEMIGKPVSPALPGLEKCTDGESPTKSQTNENTCSDEITVLQASSGSPMNAEIDDFPELVEDDRAEVDQSPHSANDTSAEGEELVEDKMPGDDTFVNESLSGTNPDCSTSLGDIAEDNEAEDSSDDRQDEEDENNRSTEEQNKPKYVPKAPKLARSDIKATHSKPNTNVGSRLADYIKSPVPVKPKDESIEKMAPKKKINKKALDREIERRKSQELSPRPKPEVEEKKEPPKIIKRSPPKSKWGNIMSQIETNKDQIKIKPKTEVKSKLEAYLTSPAPVKEKPPKKPETKKVLPTPPKLDFSKVKSKLNITSPSPKSKNDLGSKLRELSASQSTLYSNDSRRSSIRSNDDRSSAHSNMSSRVNSHSDLTGEDVTSTKSGSVKNAASGTLTNRSRRASMTSLASDTSQTSVKAMNMKNLKKSQETPKKSRNSLPPTLNTPGRLSSPSPSSPKHSPHRSAKTTDSTTKTRHASGRTDTNKLPSKTNKTTNQPMSRLKDAEPIKREKSSKSLKPPKTTPPDGLYSVDKEIRMALDRYRSSNFGLTSSDSRRDLALSGRYRSTASSSSSGTSSIGSYIPRSSYASSSSARSSYSSPYSSVKDTYRTPTSSSTEKTYSRYGSSSAQLSVDKTSSSKSVVDDQNRNKTTKSKLPTNRPVEKPVSKVHGTKTKNAAEEIHRLEELCESRTQDLNKAKVELKNIVKSFDAMAVLIQYLTEELHAFHTPHLVKELDVVHQKLKNSEGVITELEAFKCRLEQEIVDLKTQQEKVIDNLTKSQEDELNVQKSELEKKTTEHTKELEDVRAKLNEERETSLTKQKESLTQHHKDHLRKVEQDIKAEIHAIKENHEAYVGEVKVNYEEEINRMKQKHLTSITSLQGKHDDQMEELHKQHRDKLEDITLRFEGIKLSLSEKVESLKREIHDLRNKEDSLRDADTKKEIESLNLVITMRNEEIQKLRQKNSELEKKLEEIPISREKITTLQQKMENLEAICNIKSDHEKQLSDKCQILMRKYDKEHKAKKRISMDFEELVYKIQSPDIMSDSTESLFKHQLSHSPPESESNSPRTPRKSRSGSDRSSPSPRRQHRWSTSLTTPTANDYPERKLKCRSGAFERDRSSSPRSIPTPPSRNSPNNSMSMSQPLNDIEVFGSPQDLVSSVHSDSGVILRNNHEDNDLTSF